MSARRRSGITVFIISFILAGLVFGVFFIITNPPTPVTGQVPARFVTEENQGFFAGLTEPAIRICYEVSTSCDLAHVQDIPLIEGIDERIDPEKGPVKNITIQIDTLQNTARTFQFITRLDITMILKLDSGQFEKVFEHVANREITITEAWVREPVYVHTIDPEVLISLAEEINFEGQYSIIFQYETTIKELGARSRGIIHWDLAKVDVTSRTITGGSIEAIRPDDFDLFPGFYKSVNKQELLELNVFDFNMENQTMIIDLFYRAPDTYYTGRFPTNALLIQIWDDQGFRVDSEFLTPGQITLKKTFRGLSTSISSIEFLAVNTNTGLQITIGRILGGQIEGLDRSI